MELRLIDINEENGKQVVTKKFPGYTRKEIKTGDDPNGIQIKIIIPVKKQSNGFTLIELTVTMFILCFCLLAMGTHVGLVMKTTLKDKQITAGSALLQDKMEGFKRVPYTSIATDANGDTKTAFSSTFTRTWTVTSVSNNMKQVQVVVAWQGGTVAGSTVISE